MAIRVHQPATHLIGTVFRAEVEQPRPLAPHLGAHAPHLVLVVVDKIQPAVVLVHRPAVVVAPEKVPAHLVPLVEAGLAGGADVHLAARASGVRRLRVAPWQ